MPLYSYECDSCRYNFDQFVPYMQRDYMQSCDQCGAGAKRIPHTIRHKMFKRYWHHNLEKNPVLITSSRQEKEEHEKRGLRDAR